MKIALIHNHYNEDHLEAIKTEMETLGTPTIRCIWSEVYDMWLAVEGCHRIRSAADLGLTPIIQDISETETVIIQIDEINTEVNVIDLAEELTDNAWKAEIVEF